MHVLLPVYLRKGPYIRYVSFCKYTDVMRNDRNACITAAVRKLLNKADPLSWEGSKSDCGNGGSCELQVSLHHIIWLTKQVESCR